MELNAQKLRIIAIACIIIGLSWLCLMSFFFEPAEIEIQEISQLKLNQRIKTTGLVTGSFFTKNTLIAELKDKTKIKAVKFNPSAEEKNFLKKGNWVLVKGKTAEFHGEKEIIIEEVKKIA